MLSTLSKIRFEVKGLLPTIQHNGNMANPMSAYSKRLKEVSGKRKKTDADYETMAQIEWEGSLYVDDQQRIIYPTYVILGALVEAAKKLRLGELAKAGLFMEQDVVLQYKGPKDIATLAKDSRFRHQVGVVIQRARIIRTRPIFHDWQMAFDLCYDTELLSENQVVQIMETLGSKVGLSDGRPRFGRFEVLSWQPVE